jgi:DNA repair exonuclease SbcCD ATPase subunit
MLELESVSFKNFMSYGDYLTTIKLSDLGQCLIVGEVAGEEDSQKLYDTQEFVEDKSRTKSNGAGKSCIPNAIMWCLFGKTMHSSNPGDKVINFYTGKDCSVTVKLKSGDIITRTRNTDGKNELIYVKDGDENKFNADTLSTIKNQQAQLNKIFNLDWDLFCGSAFFTQYGKPWLEMADQSRKKAIERILHVDRFSYYASVAKSKCNKIDNMVESNKSKIQTISVNVQTLGEEITRILSSSKNFESNRKTRLESATLLLNTEIQKQFDLVLPDLDKLRAKWGIINKIKQKLKDLRLERQNHDDAHRSGSLKTQHLEERIKLWQQKAGAICTECEREVSASHTDDKIKPLYDKLQSKQNQLNEIATEIDKLKQVIKQIIKTLEDKSPDITLPDAENVHNQWQRHAIEIKRIKTRIEEIKSESNPHSESVSTVRGKIEELNTQKSNIEKEVKRDTLLQSHYYYIYKAYNDRSKIKSYVFEEHIPFINDRLKHYFDVFGLDVQVSLTKSLSVSSNMWGYEFQSGGERKRTDVAFMLAMYDLHEQMYGRQCNVLVLDEVDGRMDDDGIDALINIIKNDLSSKVESVLIISHRNMMHDIFPQELRVKRSNRFSIIESI